MKSKITLVLVTALGVVVCLEIINADTLPVGQVAPVYYVDVNNPAASDSNAGSLENPFRTIGKAVSAVKPGDTVTIRRGTYRETIIIDKSGSADRPIIFMAAPGHEVIVTGMDTVTGWTPDDSSKNIWKAPWPQGLITGMNEKFAGDCGRPEQLVIMGHLLQGVAEKQQLSHGRFWIDPDTRQIYVMPFNNRPITDFVVEGTTRSLLWEVKGSFVHTKGIIFRYAANLAQQGAARFSGSDQLVESCVFEKTASSGASFASPRITVRNCVFKDNGQLGFGASRADSLFITGCTVRNNNTRAFNRGWEAGGNKISCSYGVIIERSQFIKNLGPGIWFDISNDRCEVRYCLIYQNENVGLFYEISYNLYAHDNVISCNGFCSGHGSWGADGGISLSSSPGCVVERNLIIGNKEGFQFREQERKTPKILGKRTFGKDTSVWNHDETVRNNVFALNKSTHVWGWFDIKDDRHWPKAIQKQMKSGVFQYLMQTAREKRRNGIFKTNPYSKPKDLTLEKLNIQINSNQYWADSGQGLFNWGTTWMRHRKYDSLDTLRRELGFEAGGAIVNPMFADWASLDLRVPPGSLFLKKKCYPEGDVPGVKLGVVRP